MFHTVKRIIDWCGEFKGKLYLGFVMTFFSHMFTAMPLALAAYTVGLLIGGARRTATAFDSVLDRAQCPSCRWGWSSSGSSSTTSGPGSRSPSAIS